MNPRPVRVPNTETSERRDARLERERIVADQRAFLESFDRQVADIEAKEGRR